MKYNKTDDFIKAFDSAKKTIASMKKVFGLDYFAQPYIAHWATGLIHLELTIARLQELEGSELDGMGDFTDWLVDADYGLNELKDYICSSGETSASILATHLLKIEHLLKKMHLYYLEKYVENKQLLETLQEGGNENKE